MKYAAIDIGNVCVAIDKTVPFREIGFDINAPECEKLFDLVRLMEWGTINEDDFFARLSEMPECRKKNKGQEQSCRLSDFRTYQVKQQCHNHGSFVYRP